MTTFVELQQGSATLAASAAITFSTASHATLRAVGAVSAQSKRILSGGTVTEVDGVAALASVGEVSATTSVMRRGVATLEAVATIVPTEGASASFETLTGLSSDHVYGTASTSLEALYGAASDPVALPSYAVSTAYFSPLAGDAEMLTGEIGQGDVSFVGLMGLSSNKPYAASTFTLPYLVGFANDGYGPNEARWREYIGTYSGAVADAEISWPMTSTVTVTDSVTPALIRIAEIISTLTATGAITSTAYYNGNIVVTARFASELTLPDTVVTWVFNANTGAASRYDGFEFNSFFTHNEQHYGVTSGGIYLLSGETDNAVWIDAFILSGKDDFGDSLLKRVPYAYIGGTATAGLDLVTHTDGDVTYTYPVESGETLQTLRATIGKGLRARYWQFELRNVEGGDFIIDTFDAMPVKQSRRLR